MKDIWEEGKYYFIDPISYEEKTIKKKWKKNTSKYILDFKKRLNNLLDFSSDNIEEAFKLFLQDNELKMGDFLPVFRVSLTGLSMGPSLFDIASLLGKEKTIKRLEKALKTIK